MGHFMTDWATRRDARRSSCGPSTGDDDAGVDAKACVRAFGRRRVRAWRWREDVVGGGRAIATTRDETRIDLIGFGLGV